MTVRAAAAQPFPRSHVPTFPQRSWRETPPSTQEAS